MPLAKGFLHAKVQFNKFSRWKLVVFAIGGISFSYALYVFAVVMREVFRLFTAHFGPHVYLQLTYEQELFYNFWLATLALIIGFGFISKPIFLQILHRDRRGQRLIIAHEQQTLPSYVLYLLAKMMMWYGLLSPGIPIFQYFDFYEYKFLMLALPLVVFGNQWLSINRVFKRAGLRAMFITMAAFISLGLLFSVIPPVPLSFLDRIILPAYPARHYKVELPTTPTTTDHVKLNWSWTNVDLGIGFPIGGSGAPATYVHEFPFDSAHSKDVAEYLAKLKSDVIEYEWPRITARLFIDKKVPMKNVKAIKAVLDRTEIRKIYLAVKNPKEVTSFSHETYFKLQPQTSCDDYLRGILHTDRTGNTDIESMFCYLIEELLLKDSRTAYVATKQDQVFFNASMIDETALYKFVRAFYSDHPDGRLLIFFDDATEFDQYIRIINIIMKANHDDLDEYFIAQFGFTYRAVLSDAEKADYDRNEEYVRARRSFREKYPNRLYMELTDIQREYLLKKSPELKKFFPNYIDAPE
jgi:biopolymer transport protein ExbD